MLDKSIQKWYNKIAIKPKPELVKEHKMDNPRTLWIVGKFLSAPSSWQFQGIFDAEQNAINACEADNWFVAPVKLNEKVLSQTMSWPGAYYPK